MENVGQSTKHHWPNIFRALHQSNFRRFWFGQLIAMTGTQLQITTLNWLTFELTDSPLMLGLLNFVALLPVGLVSPIGGVVSDHFPPRRLILVTRTIRTLHALILTVLILTGWIQVWQIMILMFIGATSDTIELPTRFVFSADLVAEKDLSTAIALNSSAFNVARIAGPAVAGLLIGWGSEETCFLLSAFSHLIFIVLLLRMQLQAWSSPMKSLRLTESLLGGVRYMWDEQTIRGLLVLIAVSCFLAYSYVTLMPIFGRDVLHSDARGYGLLMSVIGVSAVCGALIAASLKTGHRGRWLMGVGIASPLFLALFSLSRWLPLSIFFLLLVGVSQSIIQTLSVSLLQIAADRGFQGRVVSFFGLLHNGMIRLGGLQAGALAEYVSVPFAFQLGAALTLAWMLFAVWRMPFLRGLR